MKSDEHILSTAIMSIVSCVVSELSKSHLIDLGALTENIQSTASAHRRNGDTAMANVMHQLSEYLSETVQDPPTRSRPM